MADQKYYSEKLNEAVMNPDKLPLIATELITEIKTDLENMEALALEKDENLKRIAELQTISHKLFLSQQAQPEKVGEDHSADDALADMLASWNGETGDSK